MANEITVTGRLSATKGYLSEDQSVSGLRVDMAGTLSDGAGQAVGFAAHEALAVVADIGTEGWCYVRNLDTTNYVELGVDVAATFYPMLRLEAGEFALFRLSPGVTVYAKANTAAVDIAKLVLED